MNAVSPELAPEIVQTLNIQAEANGLSVNDYLRRLLGVINGSLATPSAKGDSVKMFMDDMEILAEGTNHLPASSLTYSREDIYFDHD